MPGPILSVCLWVVSAAAADPDPPDASSGRIEELSLTALLDEETGVASWKPVAARESPGSVVVITRDQIRASGARDLIDVLRMVPGIDVGVDSWNVVSLGMRGIDTAEGKVLLLVDGVQFNEMLYASVPLGNHFPADAIESVEVVRGPGSARYGGFAELGVVRVTTRAGGDATGVHLTGLVGSTDEGVLSRGGGVITAATFLGEARVAVQAHGVPGRRSTETYEDFYGGSFDMTTASELTPVGGSAHLDVRGFTLRAGADLYRVRHRDASTRIAPELRSSDFDTYYLLATQRVKLSSTLSSVTSVSLRHQLPWRSTLNLPVRSWNYLRIPTERGVVRSRLDATLSERVGVVVGLEGALEQARLIDETDEDVWYPHGDGRLARYGQGTAFAEAVVDVPKVAVLTVGGRAELHSQFGPALAPRVALTRAGSAGHLKLMGGRGYRTPAVEALASSPGVRPEYVYTVEAEAGAKVTDAAYVTVNLFETRLYDSLQYFYVYNPETDREREGYRNGRPTGTMGGEASVRVVASSVRGSLGYALYSARGHNEIPDYAVPGRPDALVAFANHSGTATADWTPGGGVTVGPSVVVLGPRYGFTARDGDAGVLERRSTDLLVNLSVGVSDVLVDGLGLSLTAFDLLDRNPPSFQPYDDLHAPLPGMGREFLFRVVVDR